jgi:uncharacterized damage-inducible protein DinB
VLLLTEIETTLKMLSETPQRIEGVVQGVDPRTLHVKPNETTWSINEILWHLRACAALWGRSISTMLAEETPQMRYVSPRSWQKKFNHAQPAFESFQSFQMQRASLLKRLEVLSFEQWSRAGTFMGTTKGQDQTVHSYARRMADHEHHHFAQFDRVLRAVLKDV